MKLLAVTVLTNFDSHDLREMGIQRTVQELVTARALLAAEVGCDGVVASGEEPASCDRKSDRGFSSSRPASVRPARMWTTMRRSTTPTQTIAAGADYLVIGRPIRDAADPAAAAAAILKRNAERPSMREVDERTTGCGPSSSLC